MSDFTLVIDDDEELRLEKLLDDFERSIKDEKVIKKKKEIANKRIEGSKANRKRKDRSLPDLEGLRAKKNSNIDTKKKVPQTQDTSEASTEEFNGESSEVENSSASEDGFIGTDGMNEIDEEELEEIAVESSYNLDKSEKDYGPIVDKTTGKFNDEFSYLDQNISSASDSECDIGEYNNEVGAADEESSQTHFNNNELASPVNNEDDDTEELQHLSYIERQLLEAKPWTYSGEVSGTCRPQNSLLEVHVEGSRPMSKGEVSSVLQGLTDEGTSKIESNASDEISPAVEQNIDRVIENIVKQRVMDSRFDDVVPCTTLPPALKAAIDKDLNAEGNDRQSYAGNELKTRMGLADLYAAEYRNVLNPDAARAEEDKKLSELRKRAHEIFSKLMYKLDMLTNSHYVGKLDYFGSLDPKNSSKQNSNLATIELESSVPIVVNNCSIKTPTEIVQSAKSEANVCIDTRKNISEMDGSERKRLRQLNKNRRKQKTVRGLRSGKVSLSDLQKRKEAIKEKNKLQKENKKSIRTHGIALAEARKFQKSKSSGRKISEDLKNIDKK